MALANDNTANDNTVGAPKKFTRWPGTAVKASGPLIIGIFVILLVHLLKVAAPIVVPILGAVLLSLVLSPLVRRLEAIRIPPALGALVAVVMMVVGLTGAILAMAGPAMSWVEQLPAALTKIERSVGELTDPLSDLRRAALEVSELADPTPAADNAVEVRVQRMTVADLLLQAAPTTIAASLTVFVLVYFMLASGDGFLRRLVEQIPKFQDKKSAVETVREIQTRLSKYLFSISLINTVLGVITALALWLLGVPNPALWGAIAAVLNFAPYVGAMVTIVLLAMVGVVTFDTLTEALMPATVFLAITALEGQVITPMVAGRHLELNPVAIILALLALGWLWGVVGILMAVPVLVSAKIVCDRLVPTLASFLERYPTRSNV